METENSWNKRKVDFAKAHGTGSEHIRGLVDSLNLVSGERVIDIGGGYGAVSREILSRGLNVDVSLIDSSATQLAEAIDLTLKGLCLVNGDVCSMRKYNLGKFDKAVMSWFLHELPSKKQTKALNQAYGSLNEEGCLIIEDVTLNKANQKFFQNVIRKKDGLGGFSSMVKNRYFFREDELIDNLADSKFEVYDVHKMVYEFNGLRHLSGDFKGELSKLGELNDFIRSNVKGLESKVNFRDNGESISMDFDLNRYYCVKKR